MNQTLSYLNNDNIEYYTPDWVWDELKLFIPNKVIWEAFRNEDEKSCRSADYLRELGFNVVNPLCDFFENDHGEICVSNPPFNRKRDVLERLLMLDKPFMLILPNIILNTIYFIDMCKNNDNIQIIILPKRIDFIKQNGGNSRSSFHTLVVCYKIDLPERLMFI